MTSASRDASPAAEPDWHFRWKAALVREVCRRILADPVLIEEGEVPRTSMPVFVVLPNDVRSRVVRG